jgi:hypothetical protein
LPEIVTPDTGRLSCHAAELVETVNQPARFSPAACRERVLRGGFTHLDMARKYLDLYTQILAHGRLGETPEPEPVTRPDFDAKRLLPWTD